MSYIGKTPQVGNYITLDPISTSSSNTYNLLKDSVAFTPESALHMLVSLNGVIQSPLSSFSVSGSTITFLPSSGTLSSSDTIDFILVLGNVLDIGTPSDSTVTNAKTNFVSTSSSAGLQIKGDNTTAGTLQLNCEQNSHGIKLRSPAHTHNQSYTLTFPTTAPVADKALITDGSGNLSFGNAGGLVKLLEQSVSTTGGTFIVNNTYINSTYDNYLIMYEIDTSTEDERQLQVKFYMTTNASGDAGSIISGNHHSYGNSMNGGASEVSQNYTSSYAVIGTDELGNNTGESMAFHGILQNVNNTNSVVTFNGSGSVTNENGQHKGFTFHNGMATPGTYGAYYCRGILFQLSGGQNTGKFRLYGFA